MLQLSLSLYKYDYAIQFMITSATSSRVIFMKKNQDEESKSTIRFWRKINIPSSSIFLFSYDKTINSNDSVIFY